MENTNSNLRERRSWQRVQLSLVRERTEPYAIPTSVHSGADIVQLLRTYFGAEPREMFVAVYLDGRYRPTAIHTCSIGTANVTPVHPREVFTPALLTNAVALVVAHNHPDGNEQPSQDDRNVTDRLREAGQLLGIELLDHIIIGESRYYSFTDCLSHENPALG